MTTVERRGLGARLAVALAVVGPGILAGLSDDDPAGITTYSVLGADHGYRLLWVLAASTVALVVFHLLGVRTGIATGQGLVGLIRDRSGVRAAGAATILLLLANIGTTCAEYAGVAAGFELFGVSRVLSVPLALVVVSGFVLRSSFHRVEHVLMAVSSVFLAYVGAAVLASPDWGATLSGLVVPSMPTTRDAIVITTATVGTTLAPWGIAFIQSYAVDKRLTPNDVRFERIDVIVGSVLTAVIGVAVVVACAATLHAQGVHIDDAADAASALEPLAGNLASGLFAVGLIGAALLAAAVVPLSTAYSVSEFVGTESALDDRPRDAPLFYGTMVGSAAVGAAIVLIPGLSLVGLMVFTQVLNAVLLVPILIFMIRAGSDRHLMGELTSTPRMRAVQIAVVVMVTACVLVLGASALL